MPTLRSSLFAILAILLALGAVEGVAYWWMHPAPAGLGDPVLAYRPQVKAEMPKEEAPAQSGTSTFDVKSSALDVHSSVTPLPEIVAAALPSLRCTTGTAARIDRDDGVTIHVAFFEWDLSSSINVLEAYKHLPEQCMGSIGMTLIENAPPRSFVVRRQGTGDGGQEEATTQSSSSNQQSSISPFSAGETLTFDHTVFRDPRGVMVHAFKGTWVSGAGNLLGDGLRGGMEQWRQIRMKSGLKRFRPAHARVVQGAVRGIANPDRAWEIFEESMLRDLTFER
jgi:hypothetical protein